MWGMDFNTINWMLAVVVLLSALGCTQQSSTEPPREVRLAQKWELQPGDVVGNHQVIGGLGDISIALKGDAVYAPFPGKVQPYKSECVIFSSEEVPNYLLRLCGLKSLHIGFKRTGEVIGDGDEVRVALLNRQSDGRWAFVEPAKKMIQLLLQPL